MRLKQGQGGVLELLWKLGKQAGRSIYADSPNNQLRPDQQGSELLEEKARNKCLNGPRGAARVFDCV